MCVYTDDLKSCEKTWRHHVSIANDQRPKWRRKVHRQNRWVLFGSYKTIWRTSASFTYHYLATRTKAARDPLCLMCTGVYQNQFSLTWISMAVLLSSLNDECMTSLRFRSGWSRIYTSDAPTSRGERGYSSNGRQVRGATAHCFPWNFTWAVDRFSRGDTM